jgi:hypothetical protein
MKLYGIISVDFNVTHQLLITLPTFTRYWRKNLKSETVHRLFIDFLRAYELLRREVLCSIAIELGIPMKLVGLIKMCLNETYSNVCLDKHLSVVFLSKIV